MLRHLSPEPKRSTMTRSACPAALSSAASTEPMNPPPPVTISIRRPASGRVLLRAGAGSAADRRRWGRADRLDQPGRRMALDQIDQHDPSARGLYVFGADDAL